MQKIESQLTVYFENPFWVGVYERQDDGRLTVCRIVFGTQPKDYEVYQFIQQNWHLLRFSPPVSAGKHIGKRINPKRMQRDIQKQLTGNGVGTRAQQALKLQQQEGKKAHQKRTHLQKEEEQLKRFAQKQEKKKQKRKGH